MNQIGASVEKGGTQLERKAVQQMGQAAIKAGKVGKALQPDALAKAATKGATRFANNFSDGLRSLGRTVTQAIN